MVVTNSGVKVLIATNPTDTSNKSYTELLKVTEITLNSAYKKEDKVYYQNKGDQTSIITGRATSLKISIDFDREDTLHKYLSGLLFSQDINKVNNQMIQIELPMVGSTSAKKTLIQGKATINFNNAIPSGGADEIAKLSFDIFPQDTAWTYEEKDIS